ncbi:MAG: LCP family protein, partial [Chloroflexota bacterium]
MKLPTNRWLQALMLVLVVTLIAVTAYSLLAAPGSPPPAATVGPPTLTPDPTLETPTLTPSLTPSRIATPTPTSTRPKPTATPTGTPTPSPTAVEEAIAPPPTFPPSGPMPAPVVVTQTNGISLTLTVPEPMPVVSQPDNVIDILLLGSDQRGMEKVGRTDVIVIAAIHPDVPSVSLLSIPRDFYAWIPGYGFDKINTAFSHGGPELAKDTIRYNLGVEVDYYARIGFDSFIRIVDTLGGVTVAVECPLQDSLAGTELVLQPGMHHLDGRQALVYARSRRTTSDFDRHRRQQQVLRGLYRRALNLDMIPKIPSLWG